MGEDGKDYQGRIKILITFFSFSRIFYVSLVIKKKINMGHIKLFENFEDKPLGSRKKESYMKELEKLISLPEIYYDNVETWSYIINDVEPENLSFGPDGEVEMTRKEYKELLKQYDEIRKNKREQYLLDDFMAGANGIGADYDYEDLDDQPIEFWINEFRVPKKTAIMLKSIHDCIEYPLESQ